MSDRDSRLNRSLTILCAAFILVDLLTTVLGLASIQRYLERMATLTIPPYGTGIGNVLTNASVAVQAEARGLTLSGFAWYLLSVQLASALVFTGVGGLVLWRARTNWFGWFTAHVMFFLNSYAFYQPIQVALLVPAVLIDLGSVLWPTFLLYLFLFPNGAVVPRWMRWPIVLYTIVHAAFQFAGVLILGGYLPPGRFEVLLALFESGIIVIFGLMLGSQIYRYVRVSSGVERAQTRWFILGIAVLVGTPALGALFGVGWLFQTFEWGTLSLVLVPITLAIAILRYRLWDIDLVIRKTLQYALLTGMLALVYFGGVVILQGVFGGLTEDRNSPLITVITTLGIASIFNPLRRTTQRWIDRRFFRAKYDADQVLSTFAAVTRDEVDLDRLMEAVFGVVLDTMRPVKVSSWILKKRK